MRDPLRCVSAGDYKAVVKRVEARYQTLLSREFASEGIQYLMKQSLKDIVSSHVNITWHVLMESPMHVGFTQAQECCFSMAMSIIFEYGRSALNTDSKVYFAQEVSDKLEQVLDKIAAGLPEHIDKHGFGTHVR